MLEVNRIQGNCGINRFVPTWHSPLPDTEMWLLCEVHKQPECKISLLPIVNISQLLIREAGILAPGEYFKTRKFACFEFRAMLIFMLVKISCPGKFLSFGFNPEIGQAWRRHSAHQDGGVTACTMGVSPMYKRKSSSWNRQKGPVTTEDLLTLYSNVTNHWFGLPLRSFSCAIISTEASKRKDVFK